MCWLNGRPPGHVDMGSALFDDEEWNDDGDDGDGEDDEHDDDGVIEQIRTKNMRIITILLHFSHFFGSIAPSSLYNQSITSITCYPADIPPPPTPTLQSPPLKIKVEFVWLDVFTLS